MKRTALFAIALYALFTACSSGGGKKVIVMSSGKMQLNGTTIDFNPGTQHNDLTITLGSSEKAVTVKTSEGEKSYDLPDDGLYLLNLKSDTMIGNIVNYGSADRARSITNEELQHIIDSTEQLLVGKNASDASKTYFLVPNSIKKITNNLNATLLSPYQNIPNNVEVDDNGNAPETYKFFTNSQKRESLKELYERMNK